MAQIDQYAAAGEENLSAAPIDFLTVVLDRLNVLRDLHTAALQGAASGRTQQALKDEVYDLLDTMQVADYYTDESYGNTKALLNHTLRTAGGYFKRFTTYISLRAYLLHAVHVHRSTLNRALLDSEIAGAARDDIKTLLRDSGQPLERGASLPYLDHYVDARHSFDDLWATYVCK
ncbi:hypothetical protein [Vibrio breoganii]|uniref:hypothetical protein n=1 Tax=Vibrio breoganii TaxID=553239 RepID=UPI000C846599|nr:hypothetical protein [Vibrio breoganii]PMG04117.1 hypothetical protein BCV00_15690 [Vibrio breoganii]PMK32909.1 hypothetical protein BCU06_01560 [Vibrio breoganii]